MHNATLKLDAATRELRATIDAWIKDFRRKAEDTCPPGYRLKNQSGMTIRDLKTQDLTLTVYYEPIPPEPPNTEKAVKIRRWMSLWDRRYAHMGTELSPAEERELDQLGLDPAVTNYGHNLLAELDAALDLLQGRMYGGTTHDEIKRFLEAHGRPCCRPTPR